MVLLSKPDLEIEMRNCKILRKELREWSDFAATSCAKYYEDRLFKTRASQC